MKIDWLKENRELFNIAKIEKKLKIGQSNLSRHLVGGRQMGSKSIEKVEVFLVKIGKEILD